jgi:hypothetical protein
MHTEGNHSVTFQLDDNPTEVLERAANGSTSTLIAFFCYNTLYSDGRHLLYHEFPQHYVWNLKAW